MRPATRGSPRAPALPRDRTRTDRVVYDSATGQLFYDADGSGSGAAQLIATLEGAPTLSATSIVIINGSTANVFTGTAGNDSLVGTSAEDTILGLGGNDTLDGLDGNDSLDGGTGDDTYYAVLGDVLSDAGGIDLVIADGWTLGAGFENLTLPGSSDDGRGTGNELANVMDGRAARTAGLFGGGGNDTLYGTDGAVLGAGMDSLFGGDGDDEIHGGSNADDIHGDVGNDLLFGDDGNDGILGGQGNDTMLGGAGDDSFLPDRCCGFGNRAGIGRWWRGFRHAAVRSLDSSAIVVDLRQRYRRGRRAWGARGEWTFTGIERVSGTQFADRITGDAAANSYIGERRATTRLPAVPGMTILARWRHGSRQLPVRRVPAFGPPTSQIQFILDFATGADKIQLRQQPPHANLGAGGIFAAGVRAFRRRRRIQIFQRLQDATDRVIYNTEQRSALV